VCEPRQALDCFLRTRMDMLVMGDVVLHRMDVKSTVV
jgi:carbamoyltransferase